MGVKHLWEFAKQCANLKMFMHVSTGPSVFAPTTVLSVVSADEQQKN
jgi:hypothetical protein